MGLKKAEALPFGFLRREAVQHSAQSYPAYQVEVPLLPVLSWHTATAVAPPVEAVICLALGHRWT